MPDTRILRQLVHFLMHLRLHYQLGILSGGFLLGGFLSYGMQWPDFILQFLNVHILLFGGATAYNSYWDKDEGPIGGLRHPPKMNDWMWWASLAMQFIGLAVAFIQGMAFFFIYAASLLLFWLYSSPLTRWKGAPLKSLLAIGISTGANSLFMGYLSAGSSSLTFAVLVAGVGVALIVLSLYPISQIFQTEEDRLRGDQTFALTFGYRWVIYFFQGAYVCGLILMSMVIIGQFFWLGLVYFGLGSATGFVIYSLIKTLRFNRDDYHLVMKIKAATSLSFVFFLLIMLSARHIDYGIFAALDVLLH